MTELGGISESETTLYMITQIERRDEIIILDEALSAEELSNRRLKIVTDRETGVELIKRVETLMRDYLKGRVKYVSPALSFARLTLSLFAGLGAFLFTSFVILDPLLLLDEIIISLLTGGGCYAFFAEPLALKFFPKIGGGKKAELFYNELLNRIQIEPSESLTTLNRLYESFFEVNLEGSMDYNSNMEFIKKAISSFSVKELAEVNFLLKALDRRYKFRKLRYNSRKYNRLRDNSPLSPSRFTFYYLLHHYLYKDKALLN